MTARARQYRAEVLRREQLGSHLVRLVLSAPTGEEAFTSTGVPDEWVALVVPDQFQSRYYTVRSWDGVELVLDVALHDVGLVAEWVRRDCVGDVVTISEPKGSFTLPPEARWLTLVGDLTALPAMARILESTALPTRVLAEAPEPLPGYLPPGGAEVTWLQQPGDGRSDLAPAVEHLAWPEGQGYFWMAGESAQMRAVRKHLMRERRLPSTAYDVMGYWRGVATRQPRAVDPGPVWRAGKAAGHTDEQIWADYDAAREAQQ
ncbi:siderophore-interacting protein [Nocardioides nanhaiensis]|uniref:Siderophore-interacting protein n=1 Tax=Nocardioides nanhaiensis TaxID=1476871 RepID=A0ABP8WSP1_9ACTN